MTTNHCICCHERRKLHPSGLCESCEDSWAHSGMTLGEYVKWITGKDFVHATMDRAEPGDAKYGSRGETTLRLPFSLRDRLKVVAAQEQLKTGESCNMLEWIERRVKEAERKSKGKVITQ